MSRVVVLFLDGVGLGEENPQVNPLAVASMPTLANALGGAGLFGATGAVRGQGASMAPTDACLGVSGRPQSATGQAALLTGLNAPELIGGHYGPRPNRQLRTLLEGETLFTRALAGSRSVAFVNAYPAAYFAAVARGKRLHGAIPHAAQAAGLPLRTDEDLAAGRALSVDLTNAAWRNGLGFPDMPLWTPAEAGRVMARLATDNDLTFFDDWAPDMAGHRGDLQAGIALLEEFDAFLGALCEAVDLSRTLLVITSDHGNLEDVTQRQHTLNLVPTVLIGQHHQAAADRIRSLTDLAPTLLQALMG